MQSRVLSGPVLAPGDSKGDATHHESHDTGSPSWGTKRKATAAPVSKAKPRLPTRRTGRACCTQPNQTKPSPRFADFADMQSPDSRHTGHTRTAHHHLIRYAQSHPHRGNGNPAEKGGTRAKDSLATPKRAMRIPKKKGNTNPNPTDATLWHSTAQHTTEQGGHAGRRE